MQDIKVHKNNPGPENWNISSECYLFDCYLGSVGCFLVV